MRTARRAAASRESNYLKLPNPWIQHFLAFDLPGEGGDQANEGMDMEKRALPIEERICTLHADAAEKCCANIDALFYAVNNLLEINSLTPF